MANIETITEYRFTKPTGERVNVSVKYDNDTQIVTSEYDTDSLANGRMSGQWWLDALETKEYDRMNKPQKAIYNFLKARLENAS